MLTRQKIMSKSKMAVRNKEKSVQLKLDLGLANKTRKVIPFLFGFLLLIGGGFLLIKGNDLWNKLLPINEIVLQGEIKYLNKQDFVYLLQQKPNSGLLALDLDSLQAEAKRIEWVKSVEIRKVWPEKLVFIVEEHQPVAKFDNVLLTQQGTLIVLKDKQLFEDKWISQLPKISFKDPKERLVNEYSFIWNEFKQMKRDFEIINLNLNNLQVDEVNNWQLVFIDNFSINLGRKDRIARVERLVKVFKMIENRKEIKNIDLRYHNGFAIEWLDKTNVNQQELKQPVLKQSAIKQLG